MTTNQTIDGVPRELLPCPFCGGSADLKCTEGDYPDWFVQCTECHASVDVFGPGAVHQWNDRKLPAAQPQGEPVAWANWKVGSKSYVPYRTVGEARRCVEASEISATQNGPYRVVPLYAEQPAPVAVPERLVMTDGLHTYEYVTGHNAAIDKMLGVKS